MLHKKVGNTGLLIIKNSIFGMSGSIISQAIAMITSIVMGRIVGAEGLGTYSFALTTAAILFIFLNCGLGGIFQRDVAQDNSLASKYYANSLFIRVCIAIPAGLLLTVALAFAFKKAAQMEIMLLSCLYSGLSGIFTLVIGGVTAFENFKAHSIFSVVEKVFILLATIVSLLLTKSIMVMLICHNIVFAVLISSSLLFVNKKYCKVFATIDIKFCKNYIKESVPQVLSAAAEFINLKSDLLVLSLLISDVATGLYTVSSNVYIAASTIPLAVAKASTPTFNRMIGEAKNPRSMVRKSFILMEGLSIAICLCVVAFARIGILLLWGEGFEGSIVLLQVLSVSLLFMPLNRFFGYMLVGLKKQKVVAKCTWIGTIANLVGNFILVPIIGIVAVAYTTIVTELLVTVVEFFVLYKKTNYFKKMKDDESFK